MHIKLADLSTDERIYALAETGFVLCEWDIAFSLHDRLRFNEHIQTAPDVVHVAPYILYPASTGLRRAVWAHRTGLEPYTNWIEENEPAADQVGFGMIYFPSQILTEFLRTIHRTEVAWFTDTNFSIWHSQQGKCVPVHWDIRPVHLHY